LASSKQPISYNAVSIYKSAFTDNTMWGFIGQSIYFISLFDYIYCSGTYDPWDILESLCLFMNKGSKGKHINNKPMPESKQTSRVTMAILHR